MVVAPQPAALCERLAAETGLRIVGQVSKGSQALSQAQNLTPNLVIVADDHAGVPGSKVAARLRRELPSVKVMLLTQALDAESVYEAAHAGANGLLPASTPPGELLQAIKRVAAGEFVYSGDSARLAMEHLYRLSQPPPNLYHLNMREREVLARIAKGQSRLAVATQMGFAPTAFDYFRDRIIAKLGIDTTAGLTRFAVLAGLLPPSDCPPKGRKPSAAAEPARDI